jgi:predicted metal-dependent hydrolase
LKNLMQTDVLGRQQADHAAAGKGLPTPDDLTITVRDRRFGRDPRPSRWWLAGDPIASAWFAVLSATFPRGEAFFVESVKACREGAPPELAVAIRAFTAQEINHTREHLALNKAARAAGYDLSLTEANVEWLLDLAHGRWPPLNLVATAALEHFTAIIAHEVLADPIHLAGSDPQVAALWRWHAIEEIEHKGVAYDLWLHVTRDWSAWRRWRIQSKAMLAISTQFVAYRWQETVDLLAQEGLTGWRTRLRLFDYLMRRPGILRRALPVWLAWFRPGFHPWQIDDRALITRAEREFPADA